MARGSSRLWTPAFAHIRDWIFDLDNCLYPASTGLFALIDERMGAYIQRLLGCDPAEAKTVQKTHFHEHGTTLAGLMKEHGVDPHDFLDDVHDIPLDRVQRDERLARPCRGCPGRRFVFTNGDAPYARRVLERSASAIISTTSTTSTPASSGPSPTRMAMHCCASASASIPRTRCWPTTWSRTSSRPKRSA